MGLGENMDKIKEMAGQHSDQVDTGLDKADEFVDEKTGNKYSDQIDKGRDELKNRLGQQPDQQQSDQQQSDQQQGDMPAPDQQQ